MKPNELYTLLDDAGVDYEVVEVFEGARFLRIEVDEVFKHGKLWYCQGYWNDDQKPMTVFFGWNNLNFPRCGLGVI